MTSSPYVLTVHAAVAIARRGIEGRWIEQALSQPDKVEALQPTLLQALAHIAERGDRELRVIYHAFVNPPRVVTAYFA
jgi:hypothetical protein